MNKENLSVLLIEDSPSDADLFQEMLREASVVRFEVVVVERLSDGLKYLSNTQFDLILLDLSLPDSHGLETLNRIQAAAAHTPIIVLTGLDDETLALKAVSLGAQDYLIKGNVASTLLAHAIRYSIERKRLTNTLHQHEQEFKTLVENVPDVISRIDQDLRRIYVNPAFEAVIGIPSSEIIGKTYQDVGIKTAATTLWEDTIRTVFKSGQPQIIEYTSPTAKGWRYFQTRLVPEFSEEGVIST
nr:response regulator [Anaerolineae bacterium]